MMGQQESVDKFVQGKDLQICNSVILHFIGMDRYQKIPCLVHKYMTPAKGKKQIGQSPYTEDK